MLVLMVNRPIRLSALPMLTLLMSVTNKGSLSGYCFSMFFCLIFWRSKLQAATAQSTHEAELIAVALASNELIWIRKFMIEIGFAIGACSPIARPAITGVDSDLPEIDSTTTDFAPDRGISRRAVVCSSSSSWHSSFGVMLLTRSWALGKGPVRSV